MGDSTKVEVFLNTKIEQEGEVQKIEEHYFGAISKIDEDIMLQYYESDDKSKLVTFSFYQNGIFRLQRKGNPEMDFIFDQKRDYLAGTYATDEIGQMNIQIRTFKQKLRIDDLNQKGQVAIDYQLINGQIEFGKFALNLLFQPSSDSKS